jgi:hypothetical protein
MQASSADLFDTSPATLSPAVERELEALAGRPPWPEKSPADWTAVIAAVRALALAAFVATASTAHAVECLSSASAVWNAHPGSHATWRLRLAGHEGTKCWFERSSTNLPAPRVRQDRVVDSPRGTVHGEADRRTDGQMKRASSQVKASAADGPDESQARLKSQEAPAERGPLSILIWGRPMQIDATWEEMFAGRERRAK